MSLKCILQGQDLSKESLEAHIADKNNPHGVTPQQIGAATPADIPTSLPASDVYSWAKQPNKPSYTYSEVGAAASNHNHNSLYPTLTDFNSLKTSVSNGKSAVASAITDKGVSTSATASFDTMAGNIRSISTMFNPIISDYGTIMAVGEDIVVAVCNDYPIAIPKTIIVDVYEFWSEFGDERASISVSYDLTIPFKNSFPAIGSSTSNNVICSYSTSKILSIVNTGYADGNNYWKDGNSGTIEASFSSKKYKKYNSTGYETAPYVVYLCQMPYTSYDSRNITWRGIAIKKLIY